MTDTHSHQEIPQEQTQNQQQSPSTPSPSSSSSEQFNYDDSNQKFFKLSQVKPLDFKSTWLGNTNELISKFQTKMSELHREKVSIKQEFMRFAENQSRFQMSSLRKINFILDRKQLYDEFMQRTRKTIEKLHPSLIINICSYVEESVFLALARLRRVSKIYNLIYLNADVQRLFSQRDFGASGVSLPVQERWCQRYIAFRETFLYYKEIKYTVLIPQNSIKEDIQFAVDFINEVFKRAYALRSQDFDYFDLINRFMRHHRIVLALQALTFTDLAVTRKASIVAFSNYLAFNPSARQKEEITKTKYLKMIQMVEDEDYRDSLLINSKLSTYLQEQYDYEFAVFIDTLKQTDKFTVYPPVFDLVVYHLHNNLKSCLSQAVLINEDPIQLGEATVNFKENLTTCILSYRIGNRVENQSLERVFFPTVVKNGKFGYCYAFRGQFYYVLLIQPQQAQQKQ